MLLRSQYYSAGLFFFIAAPTINATMALNITENAALFN